MPYVDIEKRREFQRRRYAERMRDPEYAKMMLERTNKNSRLRIAKESEEEAAIRKAKAKEEMDRWYAANPDYQELRYQTKVANETAEQRRARLDAHNAYRKEWNKKPEQKA